MQALSRVLRPYMRRSFSRGRPSTARAACASFSLLLAPSLAKGEGGGQGRVAQAWPASMSPVAGASPIAGLRSVVSLSSGVIPPPCKNLPFMTMTAALLRLSFW